MPVTLSRIAAAKAVEIARRFELEEESRPLLKEDASPADFLRALIENDRYPDAIRLLSHGLPPRHAVWWTCLCAREQPAPSKTEGELQALRAAELWVSTPSDQNRRAAFVAAQEHLDKPAGCAAAAAFFAEGSITPEEAPPVPPPPSVAGKLASGGIVLAAVALEPQNARQRYRRFLELGIAVANKEHPWQS